MPPRCLVFASLRWLRARATESAPTERGGACVAIQAEVVAPIAGSRTVQHNRERNRGTTTEPEDGAVIHWAGRNGLRYYYAAKPSLPGRCLKVHLGHVTAYFSSGKLVRMWVHAGGEYLDEVFHQLTQLFELCVRTGGYLDQEAVVSLREHDALLAGRS